MDADEVREYLLSSKRPVVLTDAMPDLGPLRKYSRWTVKRLLSKLLDSRMEVPAKVHSNKSGGDFVYYDNDRADWFIRQGHPPPPKGFDEVPPSTLALHSSNPAPKVGLLPRELKDRYRQKRWNPNGAPATYVSARLDGPEGLFIASKQCMYQR